MKSLKINNCSIFVDNPKSWFLKYANELANKIRKRNIKCSLFTDKRKIKKGNICFHLSCTKLTKINTLKKFNYNIVIHASDLPKGRGYSPWIWNIIKGKNIVKLSAFEIDKENKSPDSGLIYFKDKVRLNGSELLDEIREKLANKILDMSLNILKKINKLKPKKQKGKPSYFRRRKPKDQEIFLKKSLISQINILRTADNDKWPAYFFYKKKKYLLKISKEKYKKIT
jgi:methionyl-tRNA formyltransferase